MIPRMYPIWPRESLPPPNRVGAALSAGNWPTSQVGDDQVDRVIVRVGRHLGHDLEIVHHGDGESRRANTNQEPIVKTFAVADSMSSRIDCERGHDDDELVVRRDFGGSFGWFRETVPAFFERAGLGDEQGHVGVVAKKRVGHPLAGLSRCFVDRSNVDLSALDHGPIQGNRAGPLEGLAGDHALHDFLRPGPERGHRDGVAQGARTLAQSGLGLPPEQGLDVRIENQRPIRSMTSREDWC